MSVYSDGTGTPTIPYRLSINDVQLQDSSLGITEDGLHFIRLKGNVAPVYKADGSLDWEASYIGTTVKLA